MWGRDRREKEIKQVLGMGQWEEQEEAVSLSSQEKKRHDQQESSSVFVTCKGENS